MEQPQTTYHSSKEKPVLKPSKLRKFKEKHAENTKEEHAINTIETPNYNPNAFTTERKKPKKTNLRIAASLLLSIDEMVELEGLFDGEMKHLSFDCPLNLRKAFNREAQANGNSVCKLLQQYMSAYVSASMVKRHAIGNTFLAVPKRETTVNVGINEMNFTQNVQNRPRRLIRDSEGEGSKKAENPRVCMIGSCSKPAVEVWTYQPKGQDEKDYQVCAFHASAFAESNVWRPKP